MRKPVGAGKLMVVTILSPLLFPLPAAADCPSPSIDVQPETVAPGGLLEIRGDAFMQECNDTSIGCLPSRRSSPIRGVDVQLRAGDDVLSHVIVDADDAFGLEVQLTVPPGTAPGTYEVAAIIDGDDWQPTDTIDVVPPEADG